MGCFINLIPYKKFVFFLLPFAFISCATIPETIVSKPRLNVHQLAAFLTYMNPKLDEEQAMKISSIYIEESETESINSDIAFAQMCLETGFLTFNGLVKSEMNNFCGLGAIDVNNNGLTFETELLGIRAHVQHLKAYASKKPLINECVDPRYKYVNPKGKAPSIKHLAGKWASDPEYSNKIQSILHKMYLFSL
jgi:putative lipoprotein